MHACRLADGHRARGKGTQHPLSEESTGGLWERGFLPPSTSEASCSPAPRKLPPAATPLRAPTSRASDDPSAELVTKATVYWFTRNFLTFPPNCCRFVGGGRTRCQGDQHPVSRVDRESAGARLPAPEHLGSFLQRLQHGGHQKAGH